MDTTIDLLTLALLPGPSARSLRALRELGPLSEMLRRPRGCRGVLSPSAIARLMSGEARRTAEKVADTARRLTVSIVGHDDHLYPPLLKEIFDPPPVLFVRGRLVAGEGDEAVAIVGARAATPIGSTLAHRMANGLAEVGATVVSGLARGIDTASHRGALSAGGRTVAVLGSALDRIYPAENHNLAERIAEAGAVVSELPFGFGPAPHNFPRRNRIIAAWGRGVVVVEAERKSGALITARLALDFGREVMAVPGHPSWPGSTGTNELIRDGARLVRDASDVAEELKFEPPKRNVEDATADARSPLLAVLRFDKPATLEELSLQSGRCLAELLAELTALELDAKVRRLPGPLFLRS